MRKRLQMNRAWMALRAVMPGAVLVALALPADAAAQAVPPGQPRPAELAEVRTDSLAEPARPAFDWDVLDPRVDLAPGWMDAESAIWNLELVATTPRPEGFFNPETPRQGAGFSNTDLAFQGNYLFQGNYNGFQVYDISDPGNIELPSDELPGCSGLLPEEDPNTSYFRIEVIQVPLADPETGELGGLWQGGDHGEGTQESRLTNQCHDITVFPEIGLAAGARAGNGILLDISDPVNPMRLDEVVDPNFAYWHSATFNNDGSKILFTDEWGGGGQARCRSTDPPDWGANAIFDIVDGKMELAGYYKLPVPQSELENCVAHNGAIIPVPGRDIMVQAWYQGGLSMLDFTDATNAVEIAFFDRGPLSEEEMFTGGYWSTYWNNGFIYGAEITRGLDVFRLEPSEHLSQNEIDAANMVQVEEFNAQLQPLFTWPAHPAVAGSYLDQLERAGNIQPSLLQSSRSVLAAAESSPGADVAAQLRETAATLDANADEVDVGERLGDAPRQRWLAQAMRELAATME